MTKFTELMTGRPADGEAATSTEPAKPLGFAAFAPAAAMALAAAVLILVGQFTPMYESVGYREIMKNTLMQQDIGWACIVATGLLTLCGLYGVRNPGAAGWAGLAAGLAVLVIAAIHGLSESARTLTSALPGAKSQEEVAVAAVGLYLTAVGGFAAIAAGVAMLWADAGRKG